VGYKPFVGGTMKLRQRHSCRAVYEIIASTDFKNRTQNKPRRLATTTGWRAPAPAGATPPLPDANSLKKTPIVIK